MQFRGVVGRYFTQPRGIWEIYCEVNLVVVPQHNGTNSGIARLQKKGIEAIS